MTDQYFVSARDAGKTALILGPFTTEKKCREYAYQENCDGGHYTHHLSVLHAIHEIDRKSYFYSIGMVKVKDGINRKGILNQVDPSWDKVLS